MATQLLAAKFLDNHRICSNNDGNEVEKRTSSNGQALNSERFLLAIRTWYEFLNGVRRDWERPVTLLSPVRDAKKCWESDKHSGCRGRGRGSGKCRGQGKRGKKSIRRMDDQKMVIPRPARHPNATRG